MTVMLLIAGVLAGSVLLALALARAIAIADRNEWED